MYDSNNISENSDGISSGNHLNSLLGGAASSPEEESGCQTEKGNGKDSHVSAMVGADGEYNASPVGLLSRVGTRSLPAPITASARRPRLKRQQEITDSGCAGTANNLSGSLRLAVETNEKGSLTPSMRKKYLKDLLLYNNLHSGLGSFLLSTNSSGACSKECDSYTEESSTNMRWALDPMEHAWMLLVVEGNLETIMDYLSEDFSLLTKKDFVTGFTAIHWLAKYGRDETLIKLLKHAEKEGCPVNVNLRGSGGLTPLHVAAMHGQYMVVKILVGAFGANVDAMDYNGRRAWQYLKNNASPEMKELLGAADDDYGTARYYNTNNNSSCATGQFKNETKDKKDEVDSVVGKNYRWGFGSFRKFLSPLLRFGNQSTRNSVDVDP